MIVGCRILFVLLLLFAGFGCGSSESTQTPLEPDTQTNADNFDTNATLSFSLTLTIDSEDNNLDLDVTVPGTHTLPLNIDDSNNITVGANDFPAIVYRACATGSKESGCQIYTNATAGFDIDLVVDACGRLVENADCGEQDTTRFQGMISESGAMLINDVSIRLRAFTVATDSDGFTALPTESGMLDINRLVTDLTTGTVTAGSLSASGSLLDGSAITLVAGGTFSSTSEGFATADFVCTMVGTLQISH